MKRHRSLFLVPLFGLLFTLPIFAQDQLTSAAETAADLRMRLLDVQAQEAERHAWLNHLDEALKPENIERSLAGIGSTRPEELREQRRRELTIERDGVRRQLDLLATNRARLESAIQVADSRAYQQSAQGFAVNTVDSDWLRSVNPRWILILFVAIAGLLVTGCLFEHLRRT